MTADEHHHRKLRFARIRRAKFWLRFMPRRARFHTYPLVGRFADFARKRSFFWSFRYPNVRPALYLGSILTLIPIPAQLPISFFLCLGFRANFMIMGGLQFVSNPATSVPFAIGTYKLGAFVLDVGGISGAKNLPAVSNESIDLSLPLPMPDSETPADQPARPPGQVVAETAKKEKTWTDRVYEHLGDQLPPRGQAMTVHDWLRLLAHLFASLLIGALIAGLALGGVLDLLWRKLILPAALHRAARKSVTATITPHNTDTPFPPPSDTPPAP